MSFIRNLFKKKQNATIEQAVIVIFQYGLPDTGALYEVCEKLESVIEERGVGEFDGHDIATDLGDGMLYMYGPNADVLFEVIKPILTAESFLKNARIRLRYGPPDDGVKEIEVVL